MAPEKIQAPFTDEQVEAMNRYQKSGLHELTCPNDERHAGTPTPLVATREGWVCSDPECDYTQDWAPATAVTDWSEALQKFRRD